MSYTKVCPICANEFYDDYNNTSYCRPCYDGVPVSFKCTGCLTDQENPCKYGYNKCTDCRIHLCTSCNLCAACQYKKDDQECPICGKLYEENVKACVDCFQLLIGVKKKDSTCDSETSNWEYDW